VPTLDLVHRNSARRRQKACIVHRSPPWSEERLERVVG
jgi:hypothetical protein